MELRSSRLKDEYVELQITLSGMGFCEEGVELQEMRQVLDALQMSSNESETKFSDCDMQQALRESELDFRPTEDGCVLNSTMKSLHSNVSICSSPDIPSETIVVQAEIHHTMDWSPPAECLSRKLIACPTVAVGNESIVAADESLAPGVKSSHDISVLNEGFNNLEENSIDNSLEASISSWDDEIHGPVSQRRVHDSGLLLSYETASSLSSNNVTPSSAVTLNNSVYSTPELPKSIHEIHEPVSVRIIHDSGLNASAEVAYASYVNNPNENSGNYLDNCRQISTSSADNA